MTHLSRTPVIFRVYLTALGIALAIVLAQATFWDDGFRQAHLVAWVALTGLFLAAEHWDINFYDEKARFGLSTSEAILFPMLVGFTHSELVLAVVLAMTVERLWRRLSFTKLLFNVASYGCAVAVAGHIWRLLQDGSGQLTVRNAGVGLLALLSFALLTHIFTSIAIALSEGSSVIQLARGLAPVTLSSTVGGMLLGLFLAATYLSASWTVFVFPFALGALYFGNRAVVAQRQNNERLEHLHGATRALIGRPDMAEGLLAFVTEVQKVGSAVEARVAVRLPGTIVWSGVRGGQVIADMRAVRPDAPMQALLEMTKGSDSYIIVNQGPSENRDALLDAFDATGLLAAPLGHKGEVGALAVLSRVGAGDFEESEGRLLQALANELTVALTSYQAFAQVEEERERFGRIFTGSQEGICLLDADGVVRAWNPALERISGHYAADLMNKVWSDRVLIRDREQRRITKLDLVGIRPAEEVELVTKEGPSRWVTMVSGPVGETEGGGWVVLVRDVTAAHEVEVAKSDFLSTISHELRTPLTTIKGSLQVLGRGRDNIPGNVADQMIDVTTRGAERLERLVMNLLAVSQIESGSIAVFPDEISLEDLVTERYEASLQGHPRSRLILPENPIGVRADRERLAQAVEHVLENALKFGGPEGEIQVKISHLNGYARLSVSDEGPGIAAADQERIFDRFVRLGEVLTRETQGAGIGLFIAKSAMEAMGGRIWVESTPGDGATFHMEVPLARPMAVAREGSV